MFLIAIDSLELYLQSLLFFLIRTEVGRLLCFEPSLGVVKFRTYFES